VSPVVATCRRDVVARIGGNQLADDIAAKNVPCLVIAGTTSHPALREAAHDLARWLPDARCLELDCGHVTHAEPRRVRARRRRPRQRGSPVRQPHVELHRLAARG
jgi:pimeloyl-ACP methyl ester carboxylesterase